MTKVKSLLVALIIIVLLCGLWTGKLTFSPAPKRTITVTGQGKVNMAPEVARFTAGVQKFAGSVDEAIKAEQSSTQAVVAALKDAGIKDEDIKTAYFSVWPQMNGSFISGYMVSNTVEVKIREISRASEILGKVINAGANNISGLNFGADDPSKQEAEARAKAITDAREKALKMAANSSLTLGKIVSISEGSQVVQPYASYRMEAGGGGGGPTVEPGSLEVTQTVTIVFELK